MKVTAFNEMHTWTAWRPKGYLCEDCCKSRNTGKEKLLWIYQRAFKKQTHSLRRHHYQAVRPPAHGLTSPPSGCIQCSSPSLTVSSPYTQLADRRMLRVKCIWSTWKTSWWDEWCLRKKCFSSLSALLPLQHQQETGFWSCPKAVPLSTATFALWEREDNAGDVQKQHIGFSLCEKGRRFQPKRQRRI